MNWRTVIFKTHPIEESVLGGTNNFNLLRLIAAGLVLYSHSFHLLDLGREEPIGAWFLWFDASVLGVSIFFFTSGFLVCRSWDTRRNPVSFLIARAVRIAPAYWCVLLVVALVLGPAVTTYSLADYYRDPDTLKYVTYGAVLHLQYLLPGVFEDTPAPGVNGSLWTIRLEVALYVMLAIAGSLGNLADARGRPDGDRWWSHPVLRGLLLFVWLFLLVRIAFATSNYYSLAGYFLFGVTCYRFRALCVLGLSSALLLACGAIALAGTSFGPILMPIALGHLILTVALHPALQLSRGWLHDNDYSYGLYLYGFPVQQALIAMGMSMPMPLLGWAVPVAMCCAALSWHLIEHPLLSRKDRIIDRVLAWRIFRA